MDNAFRKVTHNDIESVKRIEIENGLAAWSVNDYILELSAENSIFYLSESDETITGFILARLIMKQQFNVNKNDLFLDFDNEIQNEIEIYNIGVFDTYKRKGIGSFLLINLFEIAQEKKVCRIWLEVRISNITAVKFYESFGFEIIYTRKNFYVQPLEDAFVMAKKI